MEQEYDKTLAAMKNPVQFPFLKLHTAPIIPGWNDALLENLASKIDFPDTVYNRANYKKILIRFFNFYLDGDLPEGDNYPATILDAIGIASCQKKNLWQQNPHATDRNYYSPNASKPTTVNASYGNEERNNFIKHVKQLCEEITDDSQVATDNEHIIRSLAGYLALTLMVGAVKNENQLRSIFSKERYLQTLNTLVSWPENYGFSPPAETCLTQTILRMDKSLHHTSNLFTLAAQKFVESTVKTKEDAIVEYLNASLLAHTAGHGIGIIQMINELCRHLGIPWTRLKKYCTMNGSIDPWRKITAFYNTYESQYGYKWARIINDGYLRGLSQKDNLFLAYILQGAKSKYQGPQVWDALWAQRHRSLHQGAIDYGLKLYDYLSFESDDDCDSQEAAQSGSDSVMKSQSQVSDAIDAVETCSL